MRFLFPALACFHAIAASAAQPATPAKATVYGAGTFEHSGIRLRASLDRATLQPLAGLYSLTVSGKMCWVIVGPWAWNGRDLALRVATVNNAPARGSGEVKLDGRGQPGVVKAAGTIRGGSFRVNFKAGASAATARPPRREEAARPIALPPSPPPPSPPPPSRIALDVSEWGTGSLTGLGAEEARIGFAAVTLAPSGRATVRLGAAGREYAFDGTWREAGKSTVTLALGAATGTVRLRPAGAEFERIELRGRLNGRSFQARFDSQIVRR